ncbi:MAG: hypothetical protein E6Q97_30715 [Desulfurellales bacterium]|nr:MAG: hypothetical protein E6Q97_30715 [Desulfurellales bacterium]
MRVLYGATPNQCESVGGWLPFTVGCESSVSHKIRGTLYQPYASGCFQTAEQAAQAAMQIACEDSDDVAAVVGCVRCYEGGYFARHLVREEDSAVSCGHCGRCLVTVEEANEMKASVARACLAVTNGKSL